MCVYFVCVHMCMRVHACVYGVHAFLCVRITWCICEQEVPNRALIRSLGLFDA